MNPPDEPRGRLEMRLARDAAAWLPTEDPEGRRAIIAWLALIAATGVDPTAALREAIPRWFGAIAAGWLPGSAPAAGKTAGGITPTPETVALEPLPPMRRPRLWPQRPKRFPDDLFSSWLWRAAITAGAPPDRFARDALAVCHGDPDIDVSDAALHRLALASGQPVLRTSRRVPWGFPTAGSRSAAQRQCRGRWCGTAVCCWPGQAAPAGCAPCCNTVALPRRGSEPYFRRGWRFAVEVVCVRHRCRLHDSCWRCGALVAPLGQTIVARQPACAACGAILAEAAAKPAPHALRPQRGLLCVLYYAASCLEPASLREHLVVLSGRFPPGSGVAKRARSLASLLPGNLDRWFGPVDDPRLRDLLQRHAQGGAYRAWFGSDATRHASHTVDLLKLSRIRPLSRRTPPRSPWFTARPPRAAPREDDGGRRRSPV